LDGDTLFAMATGTEAGPVDLMLLTVMAAEATALATVDAIRQAWGIELAHGHLPSALEFRAPLAQPPEPIRKEHP
jgi:L-aminopeptidase/D-esterase-like protein